MNKYIDADRLRAEIIRLRKDKPFHNDSSFFAYLHGLSRIEDFIDSLQQEPQEVDLEKEIEKYYYDNFAFISSAHIPTKDIVSDIATHFYELGLNTRKEE